MKYCLILLLAFLQYTLCNSVSVEKRRNISSSKWKNATNSTKIHCKNFKCPPVENPLCVRMKPKKHGSKTKIFHMVLFNKCELEYIKCSQDYHATVLPMKSCGHHDKITGNGKVRTKRSLRLGRLIEPSKLDPSLPKMVDGLVQSPSQLKGLKKLTGKGYSKPIESDRSDSDDQGEERDSEKNTQSENAHHLDDHYDQESDKAPAEIDDKNEPNEVKSNDREPISLIISVKKHNNSKNSEEEKTSMSVEQTNVEKDTDAEQNEMEKDMDHRGEISVSVEEIETGKNKNSKHNKEAISIEETEQEMDTNTKQSQEDIEISAEKIEKGKDENDKQYKHPIGISVEETEEKMDTNTKQSLEDIAISAELISEVEKHTDPNQNQVDKYTDAKSDVEKGKQSAKEKDINVKHTELEKDISADEKGYTNFMEQKKSHWLTDMEKDEIYSKNVKKESMGYPVDYDLKASNEGVDFEEYNKDCPSICPAREVMICARCKDGVYRTFLSICHLRMFNCAHGEERAELVSRYPCVLSAPYLAEAPTPKGRVSEPDDVDTVLEFIRCRQKLELKRGDRRCADILKGKQKRNL